MEDELLSVLLKIARQLRRTRSGGNEGIKRVSFSKYVKLVGYTGEQAESDESAEWMNKAGTHCWKVVPRDWLFHHTKFERWGDKS